MKTKKIQTRAIISMRCSNVDRIRDPTSKINQEKIVPRHLNTLRLLKNPIALNVHLTAFDSVLTIV